MNYKKQAGMEMMTILIVLVVLFSFLFLASRIVPPYYDNSLIVEALKSVAENHPEDLKEVSKSTIRSELSKFYTVNNVRGDVTNVLEVDRRKEKTIIQIAYEVRVPLVANIDAVIKFDNVLDSSKPDECCSVAKDGK